MNTAFFKQLILHYSQTFLRFPIPMLLIGLTTIFLNITLGSVWSSETLYIRLTLTTALGAFVSLFLILLSPPYNPKGIKSNWWQIITLVTMVAFFWSLHERISTSDLLRFGFYTLATISLCAVAAFFNKKPEMHLWRFNRRVLVYGLLALVVGSILIIGINSAILAIQFLFKLKIHETLYGHIMLIIIGFIAVPILMGGIPKREEDYSNVQDLPPFVVFTLKFVLAPLMLIYLVIMYAYLVSIGVTFTLPSGTVGMIILGFSIFGLAVFLVGYPLIFQSTHRWFGTALWILFISLPPLMGMLFWAIGIRILEYGMTENRYIIILLGIWILSTCVIYYINRHRNLKWVFILLSGLLLLSTHGPWSIFSVSAASQRVRFEQYLTDAGLMVNGALIAQVPIQGDGNRSGEHQVHEFIRYFDQMHSMEPVWEWFDDGTPLESTTNRADIARKRLGLVSSSFSDTKGDQNQYLYLLVQATNELDVSGYDRLYMNYLHLNQANKYSVDWSVDGVPIQLEWIAASRVFRLTVKGCCVTDFAIDSTWLDLIRQRLEQRMQPADANGGYPNVPVDPTLFTFKGTLGNYSYKLLFNEVECSVPKSLLDSSVDMEEGERRDASDHFPFFLQHASVRLLIKR